MSDVLARAAEVLEAHGCSSVSWVDGDAICATCDRIVGHSDDDLLDEIAIENTHQAQMLADAGLLVDTGWWEGVNDQWKHRPMGHRLSEFANPYRESAPVAGGNGAVSAEPCPPRPTTHETLDSLTQRLMAARAATDGYRTETERLRELLDEAHAKIERMEEL